MTNISWFFIPSKMPHFISYSRNSSRKWIIFIFYTLNIYYFISITLHNLKKSKLIIIVKNYNFYYLLKLFFRITYNYSHYNMFSWLLVLAIQTFPYRVFFCGESNRHINFSGKIFHWRGFPLSFLLDEALLIFVSDERDLEST